LLKFIIGDALTHLNMKHSYANTKRVGISLKKNYGLECLPKPLPGG